MQSAIGIRYLEITKVQVKLTLRDHLLLALLIIVLTPIVFGIKNLDATASSFVLERFVSLIGIILLTPVFLPEQDKNIAELTESKFTSPIVIYLTRFILAIIFMIILISGFTAIMLFASCAFNSLRFILGTFVTAFMLGSLGFTAHAISDNIVIGYLFPIVYYAINMFYGEKLKKIYLFSLVKDSFTEKYWLFGIGAVLIVFGMLYKYLNGRLR